MLLPSKALMRADLPSGDERRLDMDSMAVPAQRALGKPTEFQELQELDLDLRAPALEGINTRYSAVPALAEPLRDIWWLHIPKTGTSFVATIWAYACGQDVQIDLDMSEIASHTCQRCYDWAVMNRYPQKQYCRDGVLSNKFQTWHLPLSTEIKQHNFQVIALFRKPAQRMLSAFYDAHHANGFSEETLNKMGSYVGRNASRFASYDGIAGCMARMLTGGFCADDPAKREAPFDGGMGVVNEAIATLDSMPFVGISEEFDESICLFHLMFGGMPYSKEFRDVHPGNKHPQSGNYDEALLEGVVDEADEKVYAAAERRFQSLREKYAGNTTACSKMESLVGGFQSNSDKAGEGKSCSEAGFECGHSGTFDCGECPAKRLDSELSKTVGCAANRCMVNGKVPYSKYFGFKDNYFDWKPKANESGQ